MPGQILTPVSVTPQRKTLQVVTSIELLAETTTEHDVAPTTTSYGGLAGTVITTDLPQYAIREHDYTVPAPPPPSPVCFRNDLHWMPPAMRSHTVVRH